MAVKIKRRSKFAIQQSKNKKTKFVSVVGSPQSFDMNKKQVDELEDRFKRRSIDLSDDVKDELEQEIYMMLTDWRDSRLSLAKKLREWNDKYEGVTKVTDNPWPGASSVHIPMPKIKAREIKSTINRNTMRPVPFLMAQYSGPQNGYDDSQEFVKSIENFIEDKIKNETNIHRTLKDAIIPMVRDGTCPVQIIWASDVERVTDYKMYPGDDAGLSMFTTDWPTPESAGLSDAEWSQIVNTISNGQRYELRFEYDLLTYNGPRAYIVPLIDFVHWPVFVPAINETVMHGKRIWYRDYDLKYLNRIGKYPDKELIDSITKDSSDKHDDDPITIARDNIEGISRDREKAKEYECFELVLSTNLGDPEKPRQKYLIDYHYKTKKILRIEKYPIRKGTTTYFPLRLITRENRLLGISLIDDIMDLSEEIDVLHRQRINTRTITHVPSFKAKETSKGRFDPADIRYRFRPGATFYLTNMDDVQQFDIRPVDLSGSTDEETLLYQIVDMVTGSSSGLSGQTNPLDPRAPARKQLELLRQSTNRIDDYVESLLVDFAGIGNHMLNLYYQYGDDRLRYFVSVEDGPRLENVIERSRLYDPNVTFRVNGTSVFMNPEVEFNRTLEIYNIANAEPIVAQNPRIRKTLWKRILDSGRVPDSNKLTPTDQELGLVIEPRSSAVPGAEGGFVVPSLPESEALINAALQADKSQLRNTENEMKTRREMRLQAAEIANAA